MTKHTTTTQQGKNKTIVAIVTGLSLLSTGCTDPLNSCVKTTEVPIVDDVQADGLLQTYRSVICDKKDGSFDVYRNGRLMYTVK